MKNKDMENKLTKDDEIRLLKKHIREIESLESERKQAEEELHILSLRQTAILVFVPDIIMEVDNNKIYTWANAAGQEFFGNDVIGKEASYYFEGEQKTYILVESLFKGDENIIYLESWQRRKDGEKRLLTWWCRVLKDKNDNVTGALSTARDITERRQAEEKILTANERLNHLLSSSSGVIYTAKCSGDYAATYISDSVTRMVGFKPQEFLGESSFWIDHIHPDDVPHISTEVPKVFVENFHYYEYRFRCKDGMYIWVRDEMKLILGVDGKPVEIIGFWFDITTRKQMEEMLKESEERFALTIESADLGIWDQNFESGEVIRNDIWYKMLGYEPGEIKPNIESLRDLIHPDDIQRAKKQLKNMISENQKNIKLSIV